MGDISELKDILGHSSIDTTSIYTRTTAKMKRKRLEKMKYRGLKMDRSGIYLKDLASRFKVD